MNLTKPQKLIYDMEQFAGGTINVICGSMVLSGEKKEEELVNAAKNMLRSNDALRIRICERDGELTQDVQAYADTNIEVLHFASKAELDSYAQNYAKQPLDFYGNLCELKVFVYPGHYGILAKIHHIVSDAWTLAIVGSQFNAFLNGVDPDPCSYCEYVETEMEYLQSQRFENDRTFFLEQFKKCDDVTYLSEKHTDGFSANRKTIVIGSELAQQIRGYATENKTSAYTLFMTVLAVYINRIKMNTEKFYLGTAVLNRSGAREKRTMGMFVNTVPMLMELNNDKSFAENLTGVGKTIFSAFRHQKYNYGEVLSSIRSEFGFSERLYDVMLSYQNATVTGLSTEMESTWYHSGIQNESLQIHIDDRDSEGVFRIHYDYQTDKFTEQEIERLHNHLMTLLQDAITNDTKKLYELELLTEDEKQKLLFDFNDTAADYPRDKCVHQLFEEQVERTPDKVAVIACDRTLTYTELNEQANRIANSLIQKGIVVGDIVAFSLPRTSNMIAAMIGILKAGAAYLPIDPNYPQERIDYILLDSGAKLLITEDYFTSLNNLSLQQKDRAGEFCYYIYTSGTTGKPKAVSIKHQNVANFCNKNPKNHFQHLLLSHCKCVLAINNVSFDKCVHQLFEEQVARTPNEVAVIACDKTLTYTELNEQANRIAHSLIEKGVVPGDIVAFALSRKSHLIATVLGILKAGAAYLPIDLDWPEERVSYMLADSNAYLFITENNIDEFFICERVSDLNSMVSSENLCYIIYTSGSTGKPKGTKIQHKNLVNFCSNTSQNLHVQAICQGEKLLSIFKSCFDAFGVDWACTLTNGLTIVLCEDKDIGNARQLAELSKLYQTDIIHTTPSVMMMLCREPSFTDMLCQVNTVIIGAENFTPDLFELIQKYTKARVLNGYGPSETTIGTSFSQVYDSRNITIGKPIANTQVYIVDKHIEIVPIGVTGELCIAGDGVGAGYLNRPELTAEKFIDNPFGEGKLYKTGDLAYWREDGNIAYVGRNDFQVKIRGLRIELGEIENTIDGIDGISQAVVVVRKNSEGRQLICAFYTGEEVEAKEIRHHIGKKLPKYMLPHIFTHLKEMPLTSSGKANRKALPEVDLENITNDALNMSHRRTSSRSCSAG